MSLARALAVAAGAAIVESTKHTGTERVRIAGLAQVLEAEARVARQKEGSHYHPRGRDLVRLYTDSLVLSRAS